MGYKFQIKSAICFFILNVIFTANFAAVSFNGELGVKKYFNSIDSKDVVDGVFHGEIGYLTKKFYSVDLGLTTGSVKRQQKVYDFELEPEIDFTSNLSFSNSVDLLVGKMFMWRKYFLVTKVGANFSTVKIDNSLRSLGPKYQVVPKVKIGVAMALNQSNLLTLNYHYIFSGDGKMKISNTPPYRTSGHADYGMLTIGLLHAIM